MTNIRNSAKAVIVKDGCVLLTVNRIDDGHSFYLFPGGGQEFGEELKDAVRRECLEEIGRSVRVGELLHVREYIGANHQFAAHDSHIHQVEFYFSCMLEDEDGEAAATFRGHNPDNHQIGVEWLKLDRLPEVEVYPAALVPLLLARHTGEVYMGDTN
ncbi:NUDIX domain-containing protein [Paenibacillus chartarius]|uniref:NUDIX domain-containing protein n=1 Tax=Paenibacillus chartarius TaxID=747481 RepID=A0ABV6DVE2_9BACL